MLHALREAVQHGPGMCTPAQPLHNLMDILQKKISDSTGLQVSYHKSSPVPLDINNERANDLANILKCEKEIMPFTCLGLPMDTTEPTVDDLMPMVSRLDKKAICH